MNIKTVIFDIVDVLLCYPWEDWAAATYGEENKKRLTDAIWLSGNWKAMDLGLCTPEEFLETCYALDPEPSRRELYRDGVNRIGDCGSVYPYVHTWIQTLKSHGLRVLFLSNYTDLLRQTHPELLSFIPLMDGGIFSCDVHLVKPDPAIYEKLCQEYNLIPGECLFIDDNVANIQAARDFGLHAIPFSGFDKSYPEIMRFLGLPE